MAGFMGCVSATWALLFDACQCMPTLGVDADLSDSVSLLAFELWLIDNVLRGSAEGLPKL
jgi:hypothetical protein